MASVTFGATTAAGPPAAARGKPGPGPESKTFAFADGAVYTGQQVLLGGRVVRDGRGEQTNPDGSRYAGQFRADVMAGLGKFSCADGSVYEVRPTTWCTSPPPPQTPHRGG